MTRARIHSALAFATLLAIHPLLHAADLSVSVQDLNTHAPLADVKVSIEFRGLPKIVNTTGPDGTITVPQAPDPTMPSMSKPPPKAASPSKSSGIPPPTSKRIAPIISIC